MHPVKRSRRAVAALVVLNLLAFAVLAALLVILATGAPNTATEDGNTSPVGQTPTLSSSPWQSPSAPTAAQERPRPYRIVDDLCAVTDLRALTDEFRNLSHERTLPGNFHPVFLTTPFGDVVEMQCSVELTAAGHTYGLLQFKADLFDSPDSAHSMYLEIKGVDGRTAPDGKVTNVPRVGSAAYIFVDKSVGRHLVATDSNLLLALDFAVVGSRGNVPLDIVTRLSAVAKGTMAALAEPG